MEAREQLKSAAEGLVVNESAFNGEDKEPGKQTVIEEIEEEIVEAEADEEYYSKKLEEKVTKTQSPKEIFVSELERIGQTEDGVFEIIMEIANNGYFEKEVSLFKGAVKATFRSSTLTDASIFLENIENAELKTESRTSFFLGLYVLAAVLHTYGGKVVESETIEDRVEFIKKTIPPVFFKALKTEAAKFSELNEIIGSEGAADFF